MGIVIITLAVVGVMYGLTFVSYLSESKVQIGRASCRERVSSPV